MTFSLIAWERRRQRDRGCFSTHACVWTKEGSCFLACVLVCVCAHPPYFECTPERERVMCVECVRGGEIKLAAWNLCDSNTVFSERQTLGEWGKTGLSLLFMTVNSLCIPLSMTGCMFMCSPSISSHTQWRLTDMFVCVWQQAFLSCMHCPLYRMRVCACFWQIHLTRPHIGYSCFCIYMSDCAHECHTSRERH